MAHSETQNTQTQTIGNPYRVNKLAFHPQAIQRLREGDNRTLLQVHLMPQNACNQRCNFCSYRMPDNKNSSDFDESKRLPIETIEKLIEDFKEIGVQAVEVTGGGEPLAHKQRNQMFEMLFDAGFDVGLVTNGTLVDEELAELLAPNLTWMRVSLDAATPESYIKIRRTSEKHFLNATDALRKIRRVGNHKSEFRLGSGFVMSNGNELEVYEFCKMAKELGADNVRLSMTFSDQHLEYFENREKVEEGIEQAERAIKDFQDDTFRIINLMPERYGNIVEAENNYPACYTKDVLCVVEGEGYVFTCCTFTGSQKGRLGNILEHPEGFKGVWRDSQAFRKNLDPRNYCKVSCLYRERNLEMINIVDHDIKPKVSDEKPIHVNFI